MILVKISLQFSTKFILWIVIPFKSLAANLIAVIIFLKIGSNEVKVINVPHGKVVDMTAAGDSFNGSFLAFMHNNNFSIEENILRAHSVTSEVIKHKGAIIDKKYMPMI